MPFESPSLYMKHLLICFEKKSKSSLKQFGKEVGMAFEIMCSWFSTLENVYCIEHGINMAQLLA